MLIAAASNPLFLLAVLACPLGMGLMMVFMARGRRGIKPSGGDGAGTSLAELKAEQARLAEKIEALEPKQGSTQVGAELRHKAGRVG